MTFWLDAFLSVYRAYLFFLLFFSFLLFLIYLSKWIVMMFIVFFFP